MIILEIKDLYVSVENFVEVDYEILILCGVDFIVKFGEIYVLMGFNGLGKLMLFYVIVGYFKYYVMLGIIIFDGVDVLVMSIDECVWVGLFLVM